MANAIREVNDTGGWVETPGEEENLPNDDDWIWGVVASDMDVV